LQNLTLKGCCHSQEACQRHLLSTNLIVRLVHMNPSFVVSFLLLLVVAVVAFTPLNAKAADEVVNFEEPAHKEMYQALLKEYRCLKCQNQNLWDSNASLAGDLRREIKGQIVAGKSKSDIDDYLVSRYGEFVLYRPRLNTKTAILWIGPFVLLFAGLATVFFMAHRKSKSAADDASYEAADDAWDDRAVSEDELQFTNKLAKARAFLKE